MSGKNISCTYQNLIDAGNDDSPIEVTGEYIIVSVENLRKGAYYVAPLYFWSQDTRPMRVEILKPGSDGSILVKRDFTVNRHLTSDKKDQWTAKRYKLDKTRHDGTATLRIGWPDDEKDVAVGSFKLIAAPLTSKMLAKQQRIDSGLCPDCGGAGEWIAMAMVCKKHGVFLG